MAQFNYTKFLKQGGVEKYLMEADFGNDLQSRYDYVRPLMSRLPDTAYTESLIDGMEDGLRTDDKVMFDFYFVETMKALGLEDELMEAEDSLINPEAEEIEDDDLAAAADYYDSLAENDNILDEFLEMPAEEEEEEGEDEVEITINMAEGKFEVGDLVYRKFDDARSPMKVVGVRKMFASPLQAVSVVGTSGGDKLEYDETQLIKLMSPEEKANVFVREDELEEIDVKGQVQTENKLLKASNTLEDALNKVVDDLTDEQIDRFTDMILDLRDKVKAKKK
tara:strand:- start:113 stop:949 length:837 start_codon:yes stop_codon:yes gene_type:complete